MDKGIIVLIIIVALGLISFIDQKGITSFAVSSGGTGVVVDLFPLSREISRGGDIRVATRIDTDTAEEIDVTIEYTITNNQGIVVFQKSKTLAVKQTATISDQLMVHRTLDPGPYLVDVEVSYEGVRKIERDTFQVVAGPVDTFDNKDSLLSVMLVILLIFLILLWLQYRKVNRILKSHENDNRVHDIIKKKK